jgi:RNA polymerase sigma factor (sigma-70 family)
MELLPSIRHGTSMTTVRPEPGSRSDDALWQASKGGDGEAYAQLYERHARTIYNYLFRRLADWSEAEDLTAVVFLEAFRRRKDARIVEGRFLPWLYGIATNVLRNRRRAQRRHREVLMQLSRERSLANASDSASRAEAAEQMRSALRGISTLPRAQQDVVALCLLSGLSYEDAATALGIPVGTVRSRLARARASLAELNHDSQHKRVDVELGPERMAEK